MGVDRRTFLTLGGASLIAGCGGDLSYDPMQQTSADILPNPESRIDVGRALAQLLNRAGKRKIWTENGNWSRQAAQVYSYIAGSWSEGLQPTSYLPESFNAGLGSATTERDLALSAATLKLVSDIKFGRTRSNFFGAIGDVVDLAQNQNADAAQALSDLAPEAGPYRQLRDQAAQNLWRNRTRSEGFISLETTMEKLRLKPFPDISGQVIVVNIPAFDLHAYRDGRPYLRSRVIVGQEGRQTPIGQDHITDLKFSPDWTPPRSIINSDLIPALQEDPNALEPLGMNIFVQGQKVNDPRDHDWKALNPNLVSMRQPPGPNAILGGVRFTMNNSRAIYLHDTSARPLFNESLRTASSGCVRVEQSHDLAAWILREDGQPKEDDDIADLMSREESVFVKLTKSVRVEMLYLTAWINDQGVFTLYPDIYERETDLVEALAEG